MAFMVFCRYRLKILFLPAGLFTIYLCRDIIQMLQSQRETIEEGLYISWQEA